MMDMEGMAWITQLAPQGLSLLYSHWCYSNQTWSARRVSIFQGVGLQGEDGFLGSTMNPNLDLAGKEAFGASQLDLSPFATVVAFDPVLPLARVPVPAGQGDDSAKGPYVLAFRNEETWRRAWRTCKEKIATQCEAGAKRGCSISAAKACGRPWWQPSLPFFGTSGNDDQSKREECEEREMRGCLVLSQERCSRYARETCDPIYANMRIAVPGAPIDRRFSGKPLRRLRVTRHDKLKVASMAEQGEASDTSEAAADVEEERPSLGVTTFRGRLLMQNERHDEWERMSMQWSSQAAHGLNPASLQQDFPKGAGSAGLYIRLLEKALLTSTRNMILLLPSTLSSLS